MQSVELPIPIPGATLPRQEVLRTALIQNILKSAPAHFLVVAARPCKPTAALGAVASGVLVLVCMAADVLARGLFGAAEAGACIAFGDQDVSAREGGGEGDREEYWEVHCR